MDNIAKILSEKFSIQELVNFVSELSRFHRIQGSEEIEKAGDYIKKTVSSEDVLEVELKKYSYSKGYGSTEPVVGWWVKDGELRLIKPKEQLLHSFRDSRTLVAGHSPGGEVEGEVIHVGNGEYSTNYEKVNVEGRIVLAYGRGSTVYRIAASKGAAAVLIYRKSGVENGVPYMGLFLTPDEAEKYRIPCLIISRRTAEKLIGLIERGKKPTVKVKVEAGFRNEAWIPVVIASIGGGEGEIHLTAHYCHPGGTVNDNVSGSAALMELALAFARAVKSGELEKPNRHVIKFIWIPEHYGSLAYMLNEKLKVIFNVNLDMIGEKQCLTGSTLNFVRPPPRIYHPYEAILYFKLRENLSANITLGAAVKTLAYRMDSTPFQAGSDHDVYVRLGKPGVMLLQWPDKFYHSDLDTIDKFDPEMAKRIAIAVGSAVYIMAGRKFEREAGKLMKAYFHHCLGTELSHTSIELMENRYRYLVKRLGEETLKFVDDKAIRMLVKLAEHVEEKEEGERYMYIGPEGGYPMRRLRERMGDEKYREMRELMEKAGPASTALTTLITLYLKKPVTVKNLKRMVEEDFGAKIDEEILRRLLEKLVELNVVKKYK